jgi:poly-gamma-glutamate capsule biosynthesis protein CapA/YwtB (metallophosphatase superfamily)/LAS superfamily LD-carboxypeptidase LdcB
MIKKIGLIVFFVTAAFLLSLLQYTARYIKNAPVDLPLSSADRQPITIALVGDMMFDRGVARSVLQNYGGDFSRLFEYVPELRSTDITFGNLEGPITTSTDRRGSIYSFKMNPSVAQTVRTAGFDVVSFANNHVGDYGMSGFVDTMQHLSDAGVFYAGAGVTKDDASRARIIAVKNKKIGFLGFTDVGPDWMKATTISPGVLLASDPDFETILTREKQLVDYLVVSFHFGTEYVPTTSRQRELATRAVAFGADIVVGHHPHVIQEDIVIEGKPVFFSLGNFIFDQRTPVQATKGMVAVVTINIDDTITVDRFVSERDTTFRAGPLRPFEDRDAIQQILPKKAFSCPVPVKAVPSLRLVSFPVAKPLSNYIPSDLVIVPKKYTNGTSVCAAMRAYDAFVILHDAMDKEGLSLKITYGFRGNDIQEALIAAFAEKGKSAFVAPVGQSEHILGTAFDFASGTTNDAFVHSPEYAFLRTHGYKYGFVQSFNGESTDETNTPAEPWHWRYIGIKTATAAKESGLPINLFLKSY